MEGYCNGRGAALTRATSTLTDAANAIKHLTGDPDPCVAGSARALLAAADRLCGALDRAADHSEAVAAVLAPVAPECPMHERVMAPTGSGWACRAGRCRQRARVDGDTWTTYEGATWWPPLSS